MSTSSTPSKSTTTSSAIAKRFEFHPIANIFPLMQGTEFAALVEDLRQHGLREPGWTFEGKVLDGRNRYRACEEAGIEFRSREFNGSRLDALNLVWSENVQRRHLNAGQAAIAQAKREKLEAEYTAAVVEPLREEAKRRQKAGTGQGGGGGRGRKNLAQLVGQGIERHDRSTDATLAKAAGTNRRYLEQARNLLATAPERLAPVEAGEKTLSQVIREVTREEVQAKLAAIPSEKYRVVYADPPWKYGNSGIISDSDQYGPAERHYPAMAIGELCALDIRGIAEADAVLFLWVTSPMLGECWPVIKAWGFEYKTSFVWDKVKHNFGHCNSVRHELLLVCTHGSCTPDTKKLYDSVVTIERSDKHSEKPEEFRQIIDALYPHGRRIELFARKRVPGWDCWGAEVGHGEAR